MKRGAALLVLAMGVGGCMRNATVPDVKRRMVEIVVLNDKNEITPSCGVGLIVGPNTVLTAGHVAKDLEDANKAKSRIRLTWAGGTLDANGTQYLTKFASSNADAAILKLKDQNFNVKPDQFDEFGLMTEDDVVAYPQAVVASYHSTNCPGAYEKEANYDAPMAVQMSGPMLHGTDLMIRTGEDLGPGYSGGALFSPQLGVVVGVYAKGDKAHGFATPIEYTKDLLDPRSPHRYQVLPDVVDVSLTETVALGRDERVDFSPFRPTMTGLWRLPFRPRKLALWPTAGIRLDYATWSRERVVQGYPGGGVTVADKVAGRLVAVAPVVGGRLELGNLLLKLDLPFPIAFTMGDEQESIGVAWAPEATIGLRLVPWSTERRFGATLTPMLSMFHSVPIRSPSVVDYAFNPLGERGQIERELALPRWGGRLGLEIGL